MTQHFKDQMFAALSEEIADTEQSAPRNGRPSHSAVQAVLGVAAAGALVAGVIALLPGDDGADVSVAPADTTTPASSTSSGVAAEPREYTFEPHHGTMYRVPTSTDDEPSDPPDTSSSYVGFKLATADPRLSGMTVARSSGPSGMGVLQIATIGTRQIRTLAPESTTYPAGMTPADSTGPWFFTESDGSEWIATGLLADLTAALPDVTYTDGGMHLGASLVVWSPPSGIRTLYQLRDERYTLTVSDDDVTDFSIVDLGAGRYELADIKGAAGAFSYGNRLEWRVDAHTVLAVSASDGAAEPAELLEVARTVRPATQEEMRTFPIWRGAQVERVVVKTNADPSDLHSGGAHETVAVRIEDLTANDGGEVNLSGPWSTGGVALPLGADKVGHEIRVTLIDASGHDDVPVPNACSKVVVVPPENAPAVEVTLDLDCQPE